MMDVLFTIAGLLFLFAGAELLVRGASRLAAAVGIPPLIIGLTVVAYGTSSPELIVSVKASLSGQADLALGNVLGSNIFNILFIIGISALVVPIKVARRLVRLDVPIMIGVSVLTWILSFDGSVSRGEGLLLFAGIFSYTVFLIWQSRKRVMKPEDRQYDELGKSEVRRWKNILPSALYVFIGLELLTLGARWLVEGATALARLLGVSELMIGLTIVAVGTSLPELATSVVASIRGERDIAVGNVLGSNIFNILAVLGVASFISTGGVDVAPLAVKFDIPIMIAAAVACLPVFFTAGEISRWEGALFLGYYLTYATYLILDAVRYEGLGYFRMAVWWFVIPLTLLGIFFSLFLPIRTRKKQSQ